MSSSGQGSSTAGAAKVLKRADPHTIQDKFLVGYQGWFTCAGDGEPVAPGHHGWLHWFNSPLTHGGHPNIDLWPDVSSYSQSELFPAPGLKYPNGEEVKLFSSRNGQTVKRHFHWMAEHGIDGAFLQRFAAHCDVEAGNEGVLRLRDEVGDRVREAAEAEGRVFAIMYDVSNVPADRIRGILERDWAHLLHNKRLLDSPAYLREKGKPVVALWGLGFENAGHTPELVRTIINYFRQVTPGGVYIFGGAPAHWRTAEQDADRNPGFLDVWLNEFDAISPWTVGRYRNERDADNFAENQMRGDSDLIKRRNEEGTWRKVDYVPVVLPGASGLNLSEGRWAFNDIPRQGGRFLWKQIFNAKRFGARIMYGAMWDEYDEGTALMPAVEKKRLLPASDQFQFLALDQDGYDVPSDWYMRICGFAAEGLRSERRIHETFPSKELQDYWATRPKYEEVPETSGSSGQAGGQGYEDWLKDQKDQKDEPPPPPYTLEAEEGSSADQPTEVAPSTAPTSTNVRPAVQAAPTPSVATAAATVVPSVPVVATITQVAQAGQPSGPPPVNVHSRPTLPSSPISPASASAPAPNVHSRPQSTSPYPVQGAYPSYGTYPQSHSPPQDPITALANDFGRQNIASPGPNANAASPPPVHPGRPGGRPPTAQGRPDRPLQAHASFSGPHSQSRPGSQAGYTQPAAPLPSQTPSSNSQSPVWPPPEWGTGRPQQPSAPPHHPSTSGQAGANLTRPHTFTASSYSSTSSYRPPTAPPHQPHVPSSPAPGPSFNSSIPPTAQTPPSPPHAGLFPSTSAATSPTGMSFPNAGPASGYQPAYPPYNSQGSSPYPNAGGYNASMPSSQGYSDAPVSIPSAYNPPHTSSAYIAAGYGYGGHSTASQHFSGGPSAYPQSGYSSGSSYGMPYASTAPGSSQSDGMYFPQVQAPQSQSIGLPQASTTGSGSFSPQGSSSGYDSSQAGPSAWVPGGSMNPSPPLPPRPTNYSQYPGSSSSSSSGPAFPSANQSGAIGMALNAVDKFAGKKTRQQIESGVGSLAQTGSKLLGKFSK